MKNLLEYILIHLVENPEEVRVEETEQDGVFYYAIHVHPDDTGRVIGKKGSIINAIRNIAKVRAVREGIHVQISIKTEDDQVTPTKTDETEIR